MAKLPRPKGHHTVTPGFVVSGATKVLTFLEKAFGGALVERYDMPDGSIAHCEMRLGDSVVMFGEAGGKHPPMPAMLSLYVDDGPAVDATYAKAVSAGATSVTKPQDQFYGYRSATVKDPGGNHWTICAVIEQVSPEEAKRRMAAMMKGS
jgi:uncharacterized glyoxalase superfamily protein PhnB